MRIITTGIFVFIMAAAGYAQHPAVTWTRSLGGSYSDEGVFIHQQADGSFFIVANSSSLDGPQGNITGTGPVLLMDLNGAGEVQWGIRIGGPQADRILHGAMTTDGNYVLAGEKRGPEDVPGWQTHGDIWVLKVTPSGTILWQRTYGEPGQDDQAFFVAAGPAGGCLVSGYWGNAMGEDTGWDTWVAALDSSGNELWHRTWGDEGYDTGTTIAPTADGGAIVGGTISLVPGDISIHLVKLNVNGITQWEQAFGGSGPDSPSNVFSLSDGGYLLVGYTGSADGGVLGNHGGTDIWVLRLDAQGEIVWQHCYGGIGGEYPRDAIELDGNYLITGITGSPIGGDVSVRYDGEFGDGWLLLIGPDGTLMWENTYGGSSEDSPWSVTATSNGFAFTGASWSTDRFVPGNAGYGDLWAVRFQNRSSWFGGTLYVDADADAAPGPNDPRIASRLVAMDQNDELALTGPDGHYQFAASSPATVTTTPPAIPYFTADPTARSVVLTDPGISADSLDFRYTGMGNAQDLQVFITPVFEFRPGFPVRYDVLCRNVGTIPMDATLDVTMDDSLTFDSTSTPPSEINGNSLSWNLGVLAPLQNAGFRISCTLSDSLTSFNHVITSAQIGPVAGDLTPPNNMAVADDHVVGSMDPNEISVDPGFIQVDELNDTVLDYTIRFQNTGTADAINVGVENAIPENADPSSFDLLAASHPVVVEFYAFDHKLRFQFSGIHLPDSTSDEAGSHGFLRYRIRPRAGLTISDSIPNSAAIYFDNNAPVVTNTAVTLIGTSTGVQPTPAAGSGRDFWTSPNPTNGPLHLWSADRLLGALVTVRDALGRVVIRGRIVSPRQVLDLSPLKSGIYHVVVLLDHLVLGRSVVKL